MLHTVHDAYDMHEHTRGGSPQAAKLTEGFVDRFGIVGPPDHCIERLRALVELGIDRLSWSARRSTPIASKPSSRCMTCSPKRCSPRPAACRKEGSVHVA